MLLSTKNLAFKEKGSRKFLSKYVGPFKILKRIGHLAYRLELPPKWKIHPVFHVSLLKKYEVGWAYKPLPPPEDLDVDAEYDVEDVLDVRVHKRKNGQIKSRDFLVKWLDYGPEHNSWEPESLLSDVLRENVLRDPRWASSKA